MKFALIDNKKATATKGAKGICPNCGSELIAKCGEVKVSHWAHKGSRNCDPWWENETDWHRTWKDSFLPDWQEVVLTDEVTGEKHIADIRTADEFVIEFQHSHLDPQERAKREQFYKKMIWVIDGARLKRDFPRLLKTKGDFRVTNTKGLFLVPFPEESFPSNWIDSPVPVIFDFAGVDSANDPEGWRNHLYCLMHRPNQRDSIVAVFSREYFIANIISGELFKPRPEQRQQIAKAQIMNTSSNVQRPSQYIYERGRFVKRRRL